MRVALIIPSFYPAVVYGGSTFASYDLTKEAANNGMDIWVSTT
nr:glycosyl transferase family 1 [Pelagibacterales bacterium]